MSDQYDPHHHYWFVGEDRTRVWSSRTGAYVEAKDVTFVAWLGAGNRPTRIANAFELDQVLRRCGMSIGRAFTGEEALEALSRIDAGKTRAVLGRDDLSKGALLPEDTAKLGGLAAELSSSGGAMGPPVVE